MRINIGAHADVSGILKIRSVVNNRPPNLPLCLSRLAPAVSPPPSGRVLSFNKLKMDAQFILVFFPPVSIFPAGKSLCKRSRIPYFANKG